MIQYLQGTTEKEHRSVSGALRQSRLIQSEHVGAIESNHIVEMVTAAAKTAAATEAEYPKQKQK